MTQPRATDRVRTFLKAIIDFNNGASQIDCVVKNISPTGARMDVTAAISLPNEFNLRIPHRGESYRAQLVWREKDAIGVRFIQPSMQAAAATPSRAPSNLELENARLKARVRELSRRLEDLGQDPHGDDHPY